MKSYEYRGWNKELSHEICQKLINLGKGNWNQATVIDKQFDDARKSDIVWIKERWVYDLITPYMFTANEDAGWKYNIVAAEDCQVTRYTKDGFYTMHKDGMGSHEEVINEPDNKFLHGNTRKLSMTIVLNNDYEGGDFEIRGLDADASVEDENKVPRFNEGSIIFFPSFIEHRVAPVTKGTRYSLVAWFVGPPFV